MNWKKNLESQVFCSSLKVDLYKNKRFRLLFSIAGKLKFESPPSKIMATL